MKSHSGKSSISSDFAFAFHRRDSDSSQKSEKSSSTQSPEPQSEWSSLWFGNFVQFVGGLQLSIHFTSMWPYLLQLDPHASVSFFGVLLASYSFGQAVASPVFGTWSEEKETFKIPIAAGLVLTAIGDILYAILPSIHSGVGWLMLVSRILMGVGSGNLAVLRSYCSAASTLADRNKAVATSIGSFVLGMSVGPSVQALFALMNKNVYYFLSLRLDLYTLPTYLLCIINILCTILVFFFFSNNYAGIITKEEASKEHVSVPPFDRLAAAVCIYLWFVVQIIAVNMESLCAPFGIAMYNWSDEASLLYNGILQTTACLVSVVQYAVVAFTRIGKIDKRIQIVFGIVVFIVYYLISLPWPFYTGKLNYNSTVEDGACTYEWCEYVPRVPLIPYVVVFVIGLGLAFPYIGNSIGTVFSEVLGPRQQGTMQGIFALVGSAGRCFAPLVTTKLFAVSGYTYISVEALVLCGIAIGVVLFCWRRLVPLNVEERHDEPEKF